MEHGGPLRVIFMSPSKLENERDPEEVVMNTTLRTKAVAIGVTAALTMTVLSPAFAAPVLSSTATLKTAAPERATDVRYRRGYGGGAAFAGLALGLIGAAAAASAYRGYGYYGGGPYYGSPYGYAPYGYGYAPAPVYGYAPGYAYRGYYGYRHHRHW
jgi:hypothetical protein